MLSSTKHKIIKMDNRWIILSFLFLSISAQNAYAQDSTYNETVDDCYNSYDFQKERYRYKHQKECYIGLKVPQFEIYDIDGKVIDNYTIQGKVTVINFWFTACPPCIAEMPGLNDISKKYSDEEVNFIAASTDNSETLQRFIDRKGQFGFTLVPDVSKFFYDVLYIHSGFPTTIIIDEKGFIKYFYAGGLADFRASRRIKKKIGGALDEMLGK